MPVRIVITDGTTADCTQASKLIEGITAEYLLADKGCDSDEIVVQAESQGMIAGIPPRANRKIKRAYISIYTNWGILLKTRFFTLNAGVV